MCIMNLMPVNHHETLCSCRINCVNLTPCAHIEQGADNNTICSALHFSSIRKIRLSEEITLNQLVLTLGYFQNTFSKSHLLR